jgi:hypothetical protein
VVFLSESRDFGRTDGSAMTTKDNSRPLLTPDAAAAWLAIPVKTLAWWRYQLSGPIYIKCGRSIRYRLSDLEAWVESQAIAPNGG